MRLFLYNLIQIITHKLNILTEILILDELYFLTIQTQTKLNISFELFNSHAIYDLKLFMNGFINELNIANHWNFDPTSLNYDEMIRDPIN